MFVSSRRKSGFFCLFLHFLLVVNCFGQLVDDISTKSNGQQNPKINSIKKNNRVTSDSVQPPAAGSDSVVLGDKFSSLNKKYETQSAGTSAGSVTTGYLTSTIISTIAAKKCKYFNLFNELYRKNEIVI